MLLMTLRYVMEYKRFLLRMLVFCVKDYYWMKGRQEWARACRDTSLLIQKFKTHVKTWFASKVILVQKNPTVQILGFLP